MTISRKQRSHYSAMYQRPHVLQNLDVEVLYEVPLVMEEETSGTGCRECLKSAISTTRLKDWTAMIDAWKHPEKNVTIALVGKYTQLTMPTFLL